MTNKKNHISDEDLAALLDGNISKEDMDNIFSTLQVDSETAEILALSPEIDRMVSECETRILPMRALAAANPENLCSFECEAFILQHLDYDIDNWTLLEEAKANNWIREDGTPLHLVGKLLELKGLYVERRYESTIENLEDALNAGKQVIAIVDQNIIDGKGNADIPKFHAIYVTSVEDGSVDYLNISTLLEETISPEDFRKAWKSSGNYLVTASETPNGYNPQPINVEDISLDADLEELTEAIAENAHDIWARARMDEGWTYGDVRDDKQKRHPDLVPYSMLPDSEKEYDRIMAMNTLRLVRRLGFDIINSNK